MKIIDLDYEIYCPKCGSTDIDKEDITPKTRISMNNYNPFSRSYIDRQKTALLTCKNCGNTVTVGISARPSGYLEISETGKGC